MQCDEVRLYLESYVKNELPYSLHKKIFNHINNCRNCSLDADVVKLIFSDSQIRSHSNSFVSKRHEKSFQKNKFNDYGNYSFDEESYNLNINKDSLTRIKVKKNRGGKFIILSTILTAVLFAAIIGFLFYNQESVAFLSIDKLYGDIFIDSKKIDNYGMLKPGDWLNSAENSKSRIKLGVLGEIEIEPSTKIKLLQVNASGNYFYLQSGGIKASIWGAPKHLLIDSPTGEIIDFGSTFNYKVNSDKNSILKVESGWAAIHFNSQFVIVPAGNECETNNEIGIPFSINRSKEFKQKLKDFENHEVVSMSELIKYAGKVDLISLWYLLMSSSKNERQEIFNKIKQLDPKAGNVLVGNIIKLDENEMNQLWETLGLGGKNYWKILRSTSTINSPKEM